MKYFSDIIRQGYLIFNFIKLDKYHIKRAYYALIYSDNSTINMINSSIRDCESKISTSRFINTKIFIINCKFVNMTGLSETGGLSAQEESQILIYGALFIQNYGIITSNFLIKNCYNVSLTEVTIILNDNLVAISVVDALVYIISLQIRGSQVFSMNKLPNSIVTFKNLFELNMQKSSFIHINSFYSPIQIYFDSLQLVNIEQTMKDFNLTINSTEFINCSSHTSGGALYLMSYYPIYIINCTFLSNFALDSGGAIFYLYYHPNHTFVINNSTFILNIAGMEGGSIKYTNNTVYFQFINNIYHTNFAYYGNNLAGFPSKAILVEIINYENWTNIYNSNYAEIYAKYSCNYLDEIVNDACEILKKNFIYNDKRYLYNISVFSINISKENIFKDKIIILLLDDNNQIVSTRNALCNIEKSETKLMNLDSQTNEYQFNDTSNIISNQLLDLSRLQIYFPNE